MLMLFITYVKPTHIIHYCISLYKLRAYYTNIVQEPTSAVCYRVENQVGAEGLRILTRPEEIAPFTRETLLPGEYIYIYIYKQHIYIYMYIYIYIYIYIYRSTVAKPITGSGSIQLKCLMGSWMESMTSPPSTPGRRNDFFGWSCE